MADLPGTPDDQRLGSVLKRAEQAVLKAKLAALKPVGLTLAQVVALEELERQPGVTAAMLARACLVTPQAMMILLKTTEQQGLISRSAHPRHPNVLELNLTDAGRTALATGRERLSPVERRVAAAFSAFELGELRKLLSRLGDAFDTA
jgi:DNA-binding MarR family transcriptional regulator